MATIIEHDVHDGGNMSSAVTAIVAIIAMLLLVIVVLSVLGVFPFTRRIPQSNDTTPPANLNIDVSLPSEQQY